MLYLRKKLINTASNEQTEVTAESIGLGNVLNVQQIPESEKGSVNGVATLSADGFVEQLPLATTTTLISNDNVHIPTVKAVSDSLLNLALKEHIHDSQSKFQLNSASANNGEVVRYQELVAEHNANGTHKENIIDQAEMALTTSASVSGDAVRYDEFSLQHTSSTGEHNQAAATAIEALHQHTYPNTQSSGLNPDNYDATGDYTWIGIRGTETTSATWYIRHVKVTSLAKFQTWVKGGSAINIETSLYWRLQISGVWTTFTSFMNHDHVVTDNITYYVSVSGSDTTGDGTNSAPWATPTKALSVLGNLRVQEGKTLTIECDDGIYILTSSITNLPKGFNLTGKNTYTKTMSSVQSSSGSSGAYSIVLNMDSVTNITTNDDCIISAASGGTDPRYVMGYWAITNVDSVNNRITVSSTSNSGIPSGAVTATVTIIKTKLAFTGVTGIYLTNYIGGNISKIGIVGNNTAATYGVFCDNTSLTMTTPVGIRGFGGNGVHMLNGGKLIALSIAISSNAGYGVSCRLRSFCMLTSAIITGNANNGLVVETFAMVNASSSTITGNNTWQVAGLNSCYINITSANVIGTSAISAASYSYIKAVTANIIGTITPSLNTQGNEYAYIDS